MQAAKKAVESIKETAANIGASAKSGLEKTKATVQEKAEKMGACGGDTMQKDMATEKKEERINQAEMEKQEAREHNAAAKQSAITGHVTDGEGHYTTTRPATEYRLGQHMGDNRMSTMMPGYGHGPGLHGPGHDELTEDIMGSYPIGTNTGMNTTTADDAPMGGTAPGSGPNFS